MAEVFSPYFLSTSVASESLIAQTAFPESQAVLDALVDTMKARLRVVQLKKGGSKVEEPTNTGFAAGFYFDQLCLDLTDGRTAKYLLASPTSNFPKYKVPKPI